MALKYLKEFLKKLKFDSPDYFTNLGTKLETITPITPIDTIKKKFNCNRWCKSVKISSLLYELSSLCFKEKYNGNAITWDQEDIEAKEIKSFIKIAYDDVVKPKEVNEAEEADTEEADVTEEEIGEVVYDNTDYFFEIRHEKYGERFYPEFYIYLINNTQGIKPSTGIIRTNDHEYNKLLCPFFKKAKYKLKITEAFKSKLDNLEAKIKRESDFEKIEKADFYIKREKTYRIAAELAGDKKYYKYNYTDRYMFEGSYRTPEISGEFKSKDFLNLLTEDYLKDANNTPKIFFESIKVDGISEITEIN
tara:strand:+ start:5208 stop:6125 length:918 start_codon:yes stop_codon:yes gene_type:complete